MAAMLAPTYPSEDSTGWANFDMSLIHPSHGFSFDTHPPQLSAAEKLLAAMEAEEDSVEEMVMEDTEEAEDSDSSFDTPFSSFHASSLSLHEDGQRSISTNGKGKGAISPPISLQLERISSCYFEPPALGETILAPLDSGLAAQLRAHSPAVTPAASYVDLHTDLFTPQQASAPMASFPSASSMMMRSYSAPIHTQAQHDDLRKRWNAESAQSRAAAPRRSTARTGSRRARAADDMSMWASTSSQPQGSTSYGSNGTESAREKLLSPRKGSSPFKRSRLSHVSEESSSITSTFTSTVTTSAVTTGTVFGSFSPSASTSSVQTLSSVPLSPTASSGMMSAMTLSNPPKSPTRPHLNRFYTSPEFAVRGSSPLIASDDEDDYLYGADDDEGDDDDAETRTIRPMSPL